MSFPDFGGPVTKPSADTEEAADRYNRDISQQKGEMVFAVAEGASLATATQQASIAATAPGGRTDRLLAHQATERKDRLYVDIDTGVSAVTGSKDADFDALKAGPSATAWGANQTDIVSYDGMSATSALDDGS